MFKNTTDTLILYTTGICNLHCAYCYFEKTEALAKIDKLLDDTFKTDYYLDYAKELYPSQEQFKRVELWGGEPTLNLQRVVPTLNKLFNYYKTLDTILFSTNLTLTNAVEEIISFINNLDINHKYNLNIQVSIDGPENITDSSRGNGVTKKVVTNFSKLVKELNNLLKINLNLSVELSLKATMNLDTLRKLQTEEAIINFYTFFETFNDVVSIYHNSKLRFGVASPNIANPLPITSEDGKLFTNFCKICSELEEKFKDTKSIFKYYSYLVPYKDRVLHTPKEALDTAYYNHGFCASGTKAIDLLPDHLLGLCVGAFAWLVKDYKEYLQSHPEILNETNLTPKLFSEISMDSDLFISSSDLNLIQQQYYDANNKKDRSFPLIRLNLIKYLALTGQISKEYLNDKLALKGLYVLNSVSTNCQKDNMILCHTKAVSPVSEMRFFLNGAEKYIMPELFKED